MNREGKNAASSKAKQMLIDGESWDDIMKETGLRQKDLKRIQTNEISSHILHVNKL
ncbi:hypothetical protein SAMN02745163_01099 [Clostridium cavendishii DSM 21758]|uniref:Uncharacterized protein n=1 Tax=Clostridium cavendishii DSM 21758 TaxID=1121302 RepID=A0A1M6FCH6_9CLOT|nr:hypothetical protein [Clostridium cavendishii]SHI95420.1 hypothetical protein SAMN02745163_01099 [Clostridium cavendishii DSM 21758]